MTFALILSVALRLAILGGIAGGIVSVRRNASASERHLVWMLSLGAMLILPVAASLLPEVELAALPPASFAAANVTRPLVQDGLNRVMFAQAIWFLGSGVFLGNLVAAHWRARGIIRRSSVAHEWSRAIGYRVLRSHESHFAFNYGALVPVIVLPARAMEWPDQLLHATLVHEAAHIARRDSLSLLVSQIARVVYWWHPVVWFAAREAAAERERACDDAVLRNGVRASDYGEHLLSNGTRQAIPILLAAPLFSHTDGLANRISSLLSDRVDHRPVRRSTACVSLAIALPLVAVTASATPVSRHLPVSIASVIWTPVVAQAPNTGSDPVASKSDAANPNSARPKPSRKAKIAVPDKAPSDSESYIEKKLAEGTWVVDGRVVDAASFPVDLKKMARLAGEMGRLAGSMRITIDSAKASPRR